MNIDEIRPRIECHPPHLCEELASRDDLVRIVGKVDAQPELTGRQVQRLSRKRRAIAETMNFQCAELELPDGGGSTKDRFDAGEQLFHLERLAEIIIGAGA